MGKIYIQQYKKGFALLLAMIVSSIVLAIWVAILQITVSQINLASTARESEIAFQTANAGVDCMLYWRNAKSFEYWSPTTKNPPPVPAIDCFGGASVTSSGALSYNSTTGSSKGSVYRYQYQFNAGAQDNHCIETKLFVMVSSLDTAVTYDGFGNSAVGDDGEKTCPAGRVCNVLMSTGHNRSCDDLDTSIFTVQRELTVEF